MKISCGVDIIEINRVKKSIESKGEKFISIIYTDKEINYCEAKKSQKYQHYAARFAAKEAIFKALSTRMKKNYTSSKSKILTWQDFEILNDDNGKPKITLKCYIPDLEDIDVSISHCKEYAVANVIAIYKN